MQCPGNGTCSNHGTCNVTTGTCICDTNFYGATCAGDSTGGVGKDY